MAAACSQGSRERKEGKRHTGKEHKEVGMFVFGVHRNPSSKNILLFPSLNSSVHPTLTARLQGPQAQLSRHS